MCQSASQPVSRSPSDQQSLPGGRRPDRRQFPSPRPRLPSNCLKCSCTHLGLPNHRHPYLVATSPRSASSSDSSTAHSPLLPSLNRLTVPSFARSASVCLCSVCLCSVCLSPCCCPLLPAFPTTATLQVRDRQDRPDDPPNRRATDGSLPTDHHGQVLGRDRCEVGEGWRYSTSGRSSRHPVPPLRGPMLQVPGGLGSPLSPVPRTQGLGLEERVRGCRPLARLHSRAGFSSCPPLALSRSCGSLPCGPG